MAGRCARDYQHVGATDVTGFFSGSTGLYADLVYKDSLFSGSFGQKAYTTGDIVSALKICGILEAGAE